MEQFFLQRSDHELFIRKINKYTAKDQQPVLIFLHDSWGCTEMWGEFPQELTDLCNLNGIVYDRRGYGRSSHFAIKKRTEFYLHHEADELIKILDHLNIRDIIIYGHSDGATIALIAAALYPKRVKGLILEGAHSFIENSGKAAVLETRERAKTNSLLDSLKRYHGEKTHELFRLWHETWLSDSFSQWSIVPLLPSIACPVFAFQGENDEFGTIEQLNILKETIKQPVTIAEIQNAAHTPRKEAVQHSMQLIEKWFNREYPKHKIEHLNKIQLP